MLLLTSAFGERIYEGRAGLNVPLGKRGKELGVGVKMEEASPGAEQTLRIRMLSPILSEAPSPTPAPLVDPTTATAATETAAARPTPRPRVRLDPAARRTTEDHLVGNAEPVDIPVQQLYQSIAGAIYQQAEKAAADDSAKSLNGKGGEVEFALYTEDSRIVVDTKSLKGHPDAQAFFTETLNRLSTRIRIPADLRSRLPNPVIFRVEKS